MIQNPSDVWPDAETDAEVEEDGRHPQDSFTVTASGEGLRLDQFLPEVMNISRAAAVRLIEGGHVTLCSGGRDVAPDKKIRLKVGDILTATLPPPTRADILPEDIPLSIVYEDSDILVINKPAGMVVHPAPGNLTGTLVNALMFHCGERLSGIGGVIRPGIVHRIDKDTSGLLVVAKNDSAHLSLAAQLKTHTVSRIYDAICIGNLKEDSGRVDFAIGRNPTDRKKMAAFPAQLTVSGGQTVREACTHYTVKERFPLGNRFGQSFTYIQCQLETGRTHQIRVHMSALGHPLLGDPLYGGDGTRFGKLHGQLLTGQVLHAGRLQLVHPRTGRLMEFECPLPENFARLLEYMRREVAE